MKIVRIAFELDSLLITPPQVEKIRNYEQDRDGSRKMISANLANAYPEVISPGISIFCASAL